MVSMIPLLILNNNKYFANKRETHVWHADVRERVQFAI
jgi:hypothetical protein